MKCNKKTTAIYLCLTIVMASLMFSGCGKSKGGGGEVVSTKKWYQDNDGDGFGNANNSRNAENKPEGYVDNSGDCDDTNALINPGAGELKEDDIDNNCNGEEDETPPPGVIPDTNQTISYTETPGEDSDFLIDGPSYTKLDENGVALDATAASWKMVKDNVTGLIWEMKISQNNNPNFNDIHDSDNTYTWADASSVFIAKLNEDKFGNFNDWRLPTIKELSYLTDCSRSVPRINKTYFDVLTFNQVWSSTPNTDPTTEAWSLSPYYSLMYSNAKTVKNGVWAVRGKESVPELEEYSSNIVRDKTTGLMWQKATGKKEDATALTYEEALEYCENLELGGFKDWRLPSRNELISLIRYDLQSPTISRGFFSDMQSSWFWTSTTFVKPSGTSEQAWKVDFATGTVIYGNKTDAFWIRAVRGGNNTETAIYYKDEDLDGYGNPANYKKINSGFPRPDGYVSYNPNVGFDCNDADAGISPAAMDIPNNTIDENCSGRFNYTWYQDSDGDNYGDRYKLSIEAETQPAGYVRNNTDCNDSNMSVRPGMIDLADDGLDNDCNGTQHDSWYEEKQNVSWYVDSDNDGYGDRGAMSVITSETPPAGGHYASNNLDCADSNPDIRPGLIEIFGDTIDSNCNNDNNDDVISIVPDTSQIASYTVTPGEDSDFVINRPEYTKYDINRIELPDDAAEWAVIKDEVTGLYWEVKTLANMATPYTHAAAVNYAANLNLAGFEDWRLPTVTELATIAHLDMTAPAINPAVFPNVTSNQYWTSTDQGSTSTAMTVNFQRGESGVYSKSNTYFVIAVRENITARLIANGDGTVTDTRTGLIWNDLLSTSNTWDSSMTSWSERESAGYNDWRLATDSEMELFVDILLADRTFDFSEVFENITFAANDSFWTSTLALTDPTKAIVYSLITGTIPGLTIEKSDKGLIIPTTDPPSAAFKGIGVRGVKQIRFITNDDDGTVFDSKTGLMWAGENCNNGVPMIFDGTLSYCNTMTLAGHDDWRLPNRNEMLSLLSAYLEDSEGFLDAFPDSVNSYWSSTSRVDVTGEAWQISFKTGEISVTVGAKTNPNVFRAVRGGDIE